MQRVNLRVDVRALKFVRSAWQVVAAAMFGSPICLIRFVAIS